MKKFVFSVLIGLGLLYVAAKQISDRLPKNLVRHSTSQSSVDILKQAQTVHAQSKERMAELESQSEVREDPGIQNVGSELQGLEAQPEQMKEGTDEVSVPAPENKNFLEQAQFLLEEAKQTGQNLYNEKLKWLEQKKEAQKNLINLIETSNSILSDPKIHNPLFEIIEKFKYKPFILSELLFLLIILVLGAIRDPADHFLIRFFSGFLTLVIYLSGAILFIPLLHFGGSYWNLLKALFSAYMKTL